MKTRISKAVALVTLALAGHAVAQDKAPATAATLNPATSGALADFRTCARPVYPTDSKRLGHTGDVTLGFLIGVNGKVLDTKIHTSSGHVELDEAARDAISKCQFKPAIKDGQAQEAWMRMQYRWKLD